MLEISQLFYGGGNLLVQHHPVSVERVVEGEVVRVHVC